MEITKIGQIGGGQDGAIFGDLLFRFNAKGEGAVYDLSQKPVNGEGEFSLVSAFCLDRKDEIAPHSNSVFFGNEFYEEGDEFPLLYSNLYNNRRKEADRMEGVTLVYRLTREGKEFSTKLVQLIKIGFTEDPLWRSENKADVRPYGNCAIDRENGIYYAFTMRDEDQKMRYFAFDLPKACAGEMDEKFGVPCVYLNKEDVKKSFDTPYQRYIQGACFHKGLIYSLEGFTDDEKNLPAMKIVDAEKGEQKEAYLFGDFSLTLEPELIDFYQDQCIYSDCEGNVYQLNF